MFILSAFDLSRYLFVLGLWSLQFFLWLALVLNGETDLARIIVTFTVRFPGRTKDKSASSLSATNHIDAARIAEARFTR